MYKNIKNVNFFSILYLSCALMNASFASDSEESFQFDSQKFNKVLMKLDISSINIKPSSLKGPVEVKCKKIRAGDNPRFNVELIGSTLVIEARKKAGDKHDFETQINMFIPFYSSVEVSMGSGHFYIAGCGGNVTLSSGKLNAIINSPLKDLEIKAGRGNVDIQGVEGNTKLRIGYGDVKIEYLQELDATKNINLSLGRGGASICLPSSSSVHVNFQQNPMAHLVNQFAQLDVSHSIFYNFIIDAQIGSGDLSVRKNT